LANSAPEYPGVPRAALHVGEIDSDLTIETSRTQERGVKNVGPIGGGNYDDAFLSIETVHFHEQRIECLFALVVSATDTVAAVTTDRVNFVDENNAGRALLSLFEHVAHAAGPDADEHFDEI
jgi:hypothetical protein